MVKLQHITLHPLSSLWEKDILTLEATEFYQCSSHISWIHPYIEEDFAPKGGYYSFKSRPHFGKDTSLRETN